MRDGDLGRYPLVELIESRGFERRLGSAIDVCLRTGQRTAFDCYRHVRSHRLHIPRPGTIADLDDLGPSLVTRSSRYYYINAPQTYARVLAIKFVPESHAPLEVSDSFLRGLGASTLNYDDRPIIGLGTVNASRDGAIALLQRKFARDCGHTAFETVLEQIRGPPCEVSARSDVREIEQRLAAPGHVTSGVLHFEGRPRGGARCTDGQVMQRFSY